MKKQMQVLAKCVQCGEKRYIKPGEVKPHDVPFCEKCMGAMIAVKAEFRKLREGK